MGTIHSVLRRAESICSRRKVSAVSDRSDTSDRADVSGEESPGVLSDDQPPESPVDVLDADDSSVTKSMPWLKVRIYTPLRHLKLFDIYLLYLG